MRIELNCDAGEGEGGLAVGQDAALIPLVSAVNVACGAHAGDVATIERTIALALAAGAAVGAHPSYPDREGFGRRHLAVEPDELEASLVAQIEAVAAVASSMGVTMRHVKVHGALYNEAAIDTALAEVVVRAIARVSRELLMVGPPGSRLLAAADVAGLRSMAEGFADRAYEPDGSLRSRTLPGAVHADPAMAARQAVELAATGRYATLCIHGDTPGAPDIAAAVRRALATAGHEVPGGSARPRRGHDPGRAMSDPPPSVGPQHARIRAFGEAAWMVELGGGIDPASNALALAIAAAVRADTASSQGAGTSSDWGHPTPSYDSVLVPFDPARLDPSEAKRRLERMLTELQDRPPTIGHGRLHRIPVLYGGADGPDLDAVAERLRLSPVQVVEAHVAATYRVFVLGFAPGFAYLGPLPEMLQVPRREHPRPRVPVGSVAMAGSQTAVYPAVTPGGWHLIGRTDAVVWDPRRPEPAMFAPGDSVRFEPVRD